MNKIKLSVCLSIIAVFFFLSGYKNTLASPPEPDGFDIKTVCAADSAYRLGDFLVYNINKDHIGIVGYFGNEENLVIPNEIDGYIVEGIFGLPRLSPVKSITVGKNFGDLFAQRKVNLSVFYGIDELEEIRVSEENQVFKSHKGILYSKDMKTLYVVPPSVKMTSYTVPKSVTMISGEDPFRHNKTLKEVKFHKKSKVKTIGGIFNSLDNLESVNLQGITNSIGYCFYECPKLKNIYFDSRLKRIRSSFYFLDSLTEVSLPDNLTTMDDQGSFVGCPLLKKVIIPSKVNYMSGGSFYKEDGKVSVNMPSYLKNNVQPGDMNGYYATVSIKGKAVNAQGLKKIKLTSSIDTLNVGEKKQIFLYGKCKEWTITDEQEYTGTVKGKISTDSMKSGIFIYKSYHPEIVSVSASGELAALAPGTAKITVKCITKPSVKYSFTVTVTDNKASKGTTTEDKMWDTYADTIENYYNAQNEYIKTGILPDKTYKTYNSLYFVTNDEQNKLSDQVFLVHDINSDGVPELFIGRYYHETKEYTIYDAYTWYEDKAVRFLKDNDIGYRSGTCDIKEGGIILSFHSGSAWDFGFYVLQLPKSGSTVETLEHVYALRAGEYYNEYSEFYKSTGDSKTPGKITESEYIKYRDSFKTPDLPYVETTQETITSLRHGEIKY